MSGQSGRRADVREQALAAGLLAAFLWLVQHSFPGVYHDAGVHALLAAYRLAPDAYAADPFFRFGSQGDWSVFPLLHAGLIELIGFDFAAQGIVLAGAALWIAAAGALALVVLPAGAWRVWGFLLVATATWSYSPNFDTFRLNESFATARSLAMPLALAAATALLAGRSWAAWCLALVASLLHPLIGGWVLAWLVLERIAPRLVALLVPASVVVLLACVWLFELPALAIMDAEWERSVRGLTRDLLVGPAGTLRLGEWMATLGALWWASRRLGEPFARHSALLALIVAWALLLATVVGRHVPVAQLVALQTWRVLWLAQPVAAVLAIAAVAAWALTPRGRWLAAATGIAAWLLDLLAPLVFALLIFERIPTVGRVLHPVLMWCRARPQWIAAPIVALLLVLLPGLSVDLAIAGNGLRAIPWWPGFPAARGLLLAGGFGAGLHLWALLIGQRWPRRVLFLLLVPASVWAFATWDGRPASLRLREAGYLPGAAELASRSPVRPGESVAIDGSAPFVVWFWLGTTAYAESEQLIGAVFSRERWQLVGERLARKTVAGMLDRRVPEFNSPERVLAYQRQAGRQLGQNAADPHAHQSAGVRFTADGIDYLCADRSLDWVFQRVERSPAAGAAVEIPGAGSYQAIRCATRRNDRGD